MSYDLWVYSPHQHFATKEALHQKLLAAGWEVRFLAEHSFLGETQLPLLAATGPLENALLAGWPTGQANSQHLAQLFDRGDAPQLEQLFMEEDAFCTCGLAVSVAEDQNTEARKTKTQYYLRLSGMSMVSSWEFAHAVWEAIGALSDGEQINPQEEE